MASTTTLELNLILVLLFVMVLMRMMITVTKSMPVGVSSVCILQCWLQSKRGRLPQQSTVTFLMAAVVL